MNQHTPGVREDRRTGQFVPTIDGKDTSPTSYDESRALEIAKQQCTTIAPGPLEVHVTDGGAVYVTDNHRFADATFIVRIDSEQNRNPEAMGKLFAAAPDLLTALEEVTAFAAQYMPNGCNAQEQAIMTKLENSCVNLAGVVGLARAAITKAKGQA